MTKNEANKVIAILNTADGGCPYCVSDQLEQFKKAFPTFRKLVEVQQRGLDEEEVSTLVQGPKTSGK